MGGTGGETSLWGKAEEENMNEEEERRRRRRRRRREEQSSKNCAFVKRKGIKSQVPSKR